MHKLRATVMAVILAVLSLASIGTASGAMAADAAAVSPDRIGNGPVWSDCIYGGAPANSLIDYFHARFESGNVNLYCGTHSGTVHGVVHINAGHGFDHNTEACITKVLANSGTPTAGTGDGNWVYSISKNGLTSSVVISRKYNRIVTAYTNGSNTGNWAGCLA